MVYFLQAPDGKVKIGTTIRLSQRLKQLAKEHGCELRVLAVVDGRYNVEKDLHRRFAHLRIVNEWFEPGDDLLGFIVQDGKPWNDSDDAPFPDTVVVKLDATIVADAKAVAGIRGVSLADYLNDALGPVVRSHLEQALADKMKSLKGKPDRPK